MQFGGSPWGLDAKLFVGPGVSSDLSSLPSVEIRAGVAQRLPLSTMQARTQTPGGSFSLSAEGLGDICSDSEVWDQVAAPAGPCCPFAGRHSRSGQRTGSLEVRPHERAGRKPGSERFGGCLVPGPGSGWVASGAPASVSEGLAGAAWAYCSGCHLHSWAVSPVLLLGAFAMVAPG